MNKKKLITTSALLLALTLSTTMTPQSAQAQTVLKAKATQNKQYMEQIPYDYITNSPTIKQALIILVDKGYINEVNDLLIVATDKTKVKHIIFANYDAPDIEGYRNNTVVPLYRRDMYTERISKVKKELFILLNDKYSNASPETIACILLFKGLHMQGMPSSIEESIAIYKTSILWKQLKQEAHNKVDTTHLVSQLNEFETLYNPTITEKENVKQIRRYIKKNGFVFICGGG